MRNFRKILAVLLCIVCLFSCTITASAADFTDSVNDATANWAGDAANKELVYSRPMFEHYKTVSSFDIGVENFGSLYDIYAADGKIYILDSVGGRIIVTDEDFNLISEIKEVYIDGAPSSFAGARGILVDGNELYICDTTNKRLLVGDTSGNISKVIVQSVSDMWPAGLQFSPLKIVKDKMGYIYILSEGCYYGAIMYTPEFEFKSFFGANVVSTSILDAMNNLWDILFMNNDRLAVSEKKLPYSYVDMELGHDGYIYTCTGATSTASDARGSIKRLNPTGKNILSDKTTETVSTSESVYFTTNEFVKTGIRNLTHDVSSITIGEDNFIYALDVTYGRVYLYDLECNLITTFGGGVNEGAQDGTFKAARAITNMNGKVYIVDSTKNTVTVFKMNDYGRLVCKAQAMTIKGDYVDAEPHWNEVLKLDSNSLVAYRGIAKSKILQEDYESALYYSKRGEDRDTYSRAFEFVRKDFLAKYFMWIVLGAVVLIIALVVLLRIKRKKNIVLIKSRKWKVALGTLLHPADTFYEIKRNNGGSVLIATIFLAVWYAFKIIGLSTGFIFNKASIGDANAWYALAQTFGLVILFTLANWAVCTLMEGKGKLRDIYVVVCYSLMPMIIQSAAYDILSNVLTLNEASVLSIVNYVCLVFTLIIIVMGLINIHEFSFGKFFWTTVITVLAMILIVFLVFMLAILLQQTKNFVQTIYLEAFFR